MKILLIIILIILGIRALTRNIYFSVYSDLSRKMRENKHHYQDEASKQEGEVTIDVSGAPKKNKTNDDGEYVDYTEVK